MASVMGAQEGPVVSPESPAKSEATHDVPVYPTAATPDASAAPISPGDDDILGKLPDLSSRYLQDLLAIYERLGNEKMTNALIAELTKRDPEFANRPLSGGAEIYEPSSPWEAEEAKFDRLTSAKDYEGALAYLKELRATKFKGSSFPFDLQLGYTLSSLNRLEESKVVMERVLADPSETAADKSEARKALAEIEKQMAIRDGYELLEARKRPQALAAAEALQAKYPKDRDVLSLLGAAQVSNGKIDEALPVLEKLKSVDFGGESFPGQDALAESPFAVGRIEEAAAAYDELAADPKATPRERIEATRAAREIYERLSHRVAGHVEGVSEGEGEGIVFRGETARRIGEGEDQWIGVRTRTVDVDIEEDSRIIRSNSETQFGAVAFFRDYTEGHCYFEGRFGGGDYGVVSAGFSVGRERVNEWRHGWSVNADINRPSDDSLQLVAIDGTEDAIDVNFEGPIGLGRIQYSTGAYLRQTDIDGVGLGNGGGFYLELSDLIWENKLETAAVLVSYRMDYESFSSSVLSERQLAQSGVDTLIYSGALLGDALIEPEYHPHGFYLTYMHDVSQNFFFFINTGAFYDFADDQFDYQFIAGAELALTETVDLSIEGAYFSDGTAASDGQGEVLVGTVGLRMYH